MTQTVATQPVKDAENPTMKMSGRSYAAWVNAVLVPVKIHAFCCGVAPVVFSAVGGNAVGDLAHNENAQWGIGLATVPLVTFGVMAIEQKIKDRREARKAKKECQVQENASCACSKKTVTLRNFLKQTAIGYAFYAAAHMLWPSNHADCDHDHGHHDHSHTHKTEHVHDHGRGHARDFIDMPTPVNLARFATLTP